jgi:multicomponent Na+:H+ antiporter subunit D
VEVNAANLVAAPVLLPLLTAPLVFALGDRRARYAVAVASQLALLAVVLVLAWRTAWQGDILVLPLGGWGARLGIVWAVDGLAGILLTVAAVVGLAVLVYAPRGLRGPREQPFFLVLHHLMMAALGGCFVTADLFNLFVFFEVMLMASYVQLTLGARRAQLTRAFPYVVVNFVAGLLFLAGVGVVYGTAGTVSFAELAQLSRGDTLPAAFWGGAALVLAIFALKAALLPLFFWLPDAYPEAPIPINALFGGMLTKVGVYALYRAVPLLVGSADAGFDTLLAGLSAATMVVGVLGALGRGGIRPILSFHIISQVGYMTFALALNSAAGLAAGVFFVAHQAIVKSALFLAGGIVERIGGTDRLKAVRGVGQTHPWAAAGFFVPALALAGLPPFSGFWGKLFLVVAGFRQGYWVTTTTALVVSLLTLASMLKIWEAAYWGEPAGQTRPELGRDPGMLGATLGLAAVSVVMGLAVAPLMACCDQAAAQVLAVAPYVEAVLGAAPLDGGGATP